jgi:hypothetical protein
MIEILLQNVNGRIRALAAHLAAYANILRTCATHRH